MSPEEKLEHTRRLARERQRRHRKKMAKTNSVMVQVRTPRESVEQVRWAAKYLAAGRNIHSLAVAWVTYKSGAKEL